MDSKPQNQFVDIPYSSTCPTHKFDLYLPSSTLPNSSPLLCFVHGGAWRAEDKADHADFARALALKSNCPVVVPNYRLTPKDPTAGNSFRHPGHAEDILTCLSFLVSWSGPPGSGNLYDPNRLHLIGHSCAAHILSSIFLDSSQVTPSLTPSPLLLQSVKSIALSEGIYDLDLILEMHPEYGHWFVEAAFGHLSSYHDFAVTDYPPRNPGIRWLVIYSSGDSLVDLEQSKRMYEHLQQNIGGHDDERVKSDFHSLHDPHDAVFQNEVFVDLLVQFALKD